MSVERQHGATYRAGPDETWQGGCDTCGVSFGREKTEAAAASWCMGHDAAVHRARYVAEHTPPFFDGERAQSQAAAILRNRVPLPEQGRAAGYAVRPAASSVATTGRRAP